MGETAEGMVTLLSEKLPFLSGMDFSLEVGKLLNIKKVSYHHAIIPTRELSKTDLSALPELFKEQTFEHPAARITAYDTTPPKPHNEALLLSAMERAGNEETDPDAERRGLGTPATLVAVIEKLINGGFVTRKGKQLLPIKGGINLVCVLPETLTSPKLTAE